MINRTIHIPLTPTHLIKEIKKIAQFNGFEADTQAKRKKKTDISVYLTIHNSPKGQFSIILILK